MRTRWKSLLREFAGTVHRELLVALTPPLAPEKWIFIVGCYNSGTTLLNALLSRHPEIGSLPTEGQFLTDQLPKDYEFGVPRMWVDREDIFRLIETDDGPDTVRIRKEWGARISHRANVVVEKTPSNIARTRWLQAHFENAHFLIMIRNGYAVAEGIMRKAEPLHLAAGWPIDACASQWRRTYEILEEDLPHLRNAMWVRYEELTSRPQETLAEIYHFLRLHPASSPGSDEELVIHERRETVRDMNWESIARLSGEEIETINRVAGATLERYGYDLITPADSEQPREPGKPT